jgi:mono/diheme cytochrome c family protein
MIARFVLLALSSAAAVLAQQDPYQEGAKVFKLTCAQGYCHGSGGTQGRAPKLIGQNYEAAAVRKIVEAGVSGTGMPAFKDRLNAEQMNAVLFYVVRISGGDASKVNLTAAGAGAGKQMPADALKGKSAFFDALKGVNRCSTCHALEDIGLPVGPNLSTGGPYTAAAIRAGKDATVRLATVAAFKDSFPALVAEQRGDWLKVYDLTVAPPVLRTLNKSEVKFAGGATWKHTEATKAYTDSELEAVAAYLNWARER